MIHGADWQLKVHWMSNGEIQETVIPLGAARPGHWNRWTFDITWSSAGRPGSIVVTRDGVTVGSHQGANNYHRGDPPPFRICAGSRPDVRPAAPGGDASPSQSPAPSPSSTPTGSPSASSSRRARPAAPTAARAVDRIAR
ncbi:heparin lyase I family protein [Streptomyces sp. NPDC059761]|uniref:heparin lyase I family protein n=1 Tax=Streptomyces sp. NPDC059761 TaxID=3346937 RepID=UPI00365771C6